MTVAIRADRFEGLVRGGLRGPQTHNDGQGDIPARGCIMTVIHHNPECATSRNVLSIIEASGATPVVIEYVRPAGRVRICWGSSRPPASPHAPRCARPSRHLKIWASSTWLFQTMHCSTRCSHIPSWSVAPGRQRQGIGQALLSHALVARCVQASTMAILPEI